VVPALQASFDCYKVSTPSRAWLFPDGSSSLGFWVNSRSKSSAETSSYLRNGVPRRGPQRKATVFYADEPNFRPTIWPAELADRRRSGPSHYAANAGTRTTSRLLN
jgi:hypothetical protein